MELGVTSGGDSLQLKGTFSAKCLPTNDTDIARKKTAGDAKCSRKSQRNGEQGLLVKSQVVGTFVVRLPERGHQKFVEAQRKHHQIHGFPSRLALESPGKSEETPFRYPVKKRSPDLWSLGVPVSSQSPRGGKETPLVWEPAVSVACNDEEEETKMRLEDRLQLALPIVQQRRRLLAVQKTRHQTLAAPPSTQTTTNMLKPTTPGLHGQGIEALQHFCASKKQTQSYVAPPTKAELSMRPRPHNELLQNTKNELRRKCVSLPSIHSAAVICEPGTPSRKKSKGDSSFPDLKLPDLKNKKVSGESAEGQPRTSRSEPAESMNYNELGSTSRPKQSKHYNLKDMTYLHHQRMVDSQISASDSNIKMWVDKIKDNNVVVDNNAYEMFARKPVSKYSLAKVNVTMALNNATNKNKMRSMLDGLEAEDVETKAENIEPPVDHHEDDQSGSVNLPPEESFYNHTENRDMYLFEKGAQCSEGDETNLEDHYEHGQCTCDNISKGKCLLASSGRCSKDEHAYSDERTTNFNQILSLSGDEMGCTENGSDHNGSEHTTLQHSVSEPALLTRDDMSVWGMSDDEGDLQEGEREGSPERLDSDLS